MAESPQTDFAEKRILKKGEIKMKKDIFGFLAVALFLIAGAAGEETAGIALFFVFASFLCGYIAAKIEKHERRKRKW